MRKSQFVYHLTYLSKLWILHTEQQLPLLKTQKNFNKNPVVFPYYAIQTIKYCYSELLTAFEIGFNTTSQ